MDTQHLITDDNCHSKNKYYKLYKSLKTDIERKNYKNSEKLPTEIEIAKQNNVSRPTVAKALYLLCKSGYVERISGVGTFVCYKPKSNIKNFGLLIPDLGETEIFESICGHMSHLAQLKNFNLIWSGSIPENSEVRQQHIQQLAVRYIEQHIDGVFFSPLKLISEKDTVNLDIVRLFDDAGIPVVLMDHDIVSFPLRSRYDVVGVDNFRLAFILTHHLLDQGCNKVLFITESPLTLTVQMRIYGYQQALNKAKIQHSQKDIYIKDVKNTDFIECLIENIKKPGILCDNDITASRLMHSLEEHGYNVPTDVKVAGVDDIKYANYLRVSLTAYKRPCKGIAEEAIGLMLSRIQYPPQSPRTVFLDGELIIRKSTAS